MNGSDKLDTGEEIMLLTIGIQERDLPHLLAAFELTGLNITLPEYVKKLAEFWSGEK